LIYQRQRTKSKDIAYSLYLYFLGLSYRNTAKALQRFVHRSHVCVWKWIQRYKPVKLSLKKIKIPEFIVDETMIKVGSKFLWLWAATEPKTGKSSHYSYLRKEICLLQNTFCRHWFKTMENIMYQQMVKEHDIHHKHIDS
jgi:hypothetical protein